MNGQMDMSLFFFYVTNGVLLPELCGFSVLNYVVLVDILQQSTNKLDIDGRYIFLKKKNIYIVVYC